LDLYFWKSISSPSQASFEPPLGPFLFVSGLSGMALAAQADLEKTVIFAPHHRDLNFIDLMTLKNQFHPMYPFFDNDHNQW